ncbi:MAG: DUF2336 domain-containing protein [Labrys sp. (in: a-proteobacteria)]|jgi:uncharacterized protein (DUF2336 family)
MIVQQFLRWMRTAPAPERADATSALARAYLFSDLDPADRAAAEAAMTVLLDDPAPAVREALAHVLGPSPAAPLPIIHALSRDSGDIAAIVLAQSPVLTDNDLIEALVDGDWRAQVAVACRVGLSERVIDEIAALAGVDGCQALVENTDCPVIASAYTRILARHGDDASLRNAVLARQDLPLDVRQAAIATLSRTLAGFVADRGWLTSERAGRLSSDTRERMTVAMAVDADDDGRQRLVSHLRSSGQLTVALILRALLSGDVDFVEVTLAELSGLPLERVSSLLAARHPSGFAALHKKAGLPASTLPAFRVALDTMHEQGFVYSRAGQGHLSRRMVERVLTALADIDDAEVANLVSLLRRFVAEAARDESRAIAEDIRKDVLLAA